MITLTCNKCGQRLRAHDEYAGEDIACRNCKAIVTVPLKEAKPNNANWFGDIKIVGHEFMEQNRDIFQALVRYEREAPTIKV